MVIQIILGVVGFIVSLYKLYRLDSRGLIFFIPIGLFIGLLCFFVGGIIPSCISIFCPMHLEEKTIKLSSLQEAKGIQGNFILGVEYYEYREKRKSYAYYDKDSTTRYYTKHTLNPFCDVVIHEDSTLHNVGLLVISSYVVNDNLFTRWFTGDVPVHPQYRFTIPPKSITENLKL